MMSRRKESSAAGFSRLELVFLIATLLVLATLALPVLANTRWRSEQIACLGNLGKIGRAVHLWGSDHGERTPWFTPVVEGGTRGNPLANNPYFQMGPLSNQLVTPKMLVCPSDIGVGAQRKMASDFSANVSAGGFFSISYRNNSLSYLIGLHSYFWWPRSILSGDRNIRWNNYNNNCAIGVSTATYARTAPATISWTNAIHGLSGNLLFTDGAAESLSISGLRHSFQDPYPDDNGSLHAQAPN